MAFSIEQFLKSGHDIEYSKNDYILRQGDISKRAYFVKEGVVRHFVIDLKGNEKTIRLSKENDFFYSSNISFWTGESSYINCQALLNAKLLYWTKEELDSLSSSQPDFLAFESAKLKEFIIEKHKKELAGLTQNVTQRLLEFNALNSSLFNRIPHHIIASYLDMTPETLSRIRARLKAVKY
ncbi:Crp/Fnr family transcriptional regulator [Mangrovimonas xylaniphaga]|uniref:Crp/Fnr family transcriptional regulator n=1 Tax=Mangrovimonas xylaniphaga TaxID=1645915 RepID=UPI0006B412F8|nr:Crp/Fnr family transcriptional regulator [Mangrovimonas xylaniphaga]